MKSWLKQPFENKTSDFSALWLVLGPNDEHISNWWVGDPLAFKVSVRCWCLSVLRKNRSYQVLLPLITYSLPTFFAFVSMPAGSEPWFGSVSPKAPIFFPAAVVYELVWVWVWVGCCKCKLNTHLRKPFLLELLSSKGVDGVHSERGLDRESWTITTVDAFDLYDFISIGKKKKKIKR